MLNREGQRLGNYHLIRLLGQGGFAEVYLAEHIHLSTLAAVKVLSARLAHNSIEDFRTEARTIAHLIHPHIVRILDFGIEGDDMPYLVMDYAPNGTLRKRHPKGTRLSQEVVQSYLKQIAEALQYAHDRKLIHRDIKPENMLLGQSNELLLSDFGIATMAHSTQSQSVQAVMGTAPYIAPEQLQGIPRPASDQYALGIVVYEWLCGDRPFHGTFTELYSQHMFVPPPPLHLKNKEISPAIEEVVMKALAKKPEQRFVNVQTFAHAFAQALQFKNVGTSSSPMQFVPPVQTTPPVSVINLVPPIVSSTATPAVSRPPVNTLPPTSPASPTLARTSPGMPVSETITANTTTQGPASPVSKTQQAGIASREITSPASESLLPLTRKEPASFTSSLASISMPARKKATGKNIAITSISLLLVIAFLILLIPRFLTSPGSQNSDHGTPSSGQRFILTPPPAPPTPQVMYIVSYISNNNGGVTQYTLSALRTADGVTLWHTGWNNESIFDQPVISNGVVYVTTSYYSGLYSTSGYVHALRANDGTSLWNVQLTGQNGVSGSFISDRVVYVDAGSDLYALRTSDGSQLWKQQATGEFFSVPQTVVNGIAYTATGATTGNSSHMYAIRVSDGKILWKYSLNEAGDVYQPLSSQMG